jgi:SOS-response transcriptional repressor LexA
MTPRQAQCLVFIKARVAETLAPPSFQEIADHLGLRSKSGVSRLIDGLEALGYVRRSRAHWHNIELVDRSRPSCPHCRNLVGSAACLAAATQQNATASRLPVAPLATNSGRTLEQGERTYHEARP